MQLRAIGDQIESLLLVNDLPVVKKKAEEEKNKERRRIHDGGIQGRTGSKHCYWYGVAARKAIERNSHCKGDAAKRVQPPEWITATV